MQHFTRSIALTVLLFSLILSTPCMAQQNGAPSAGAVIRRQQADIENLKKTVEEQQEQIQTLKQNIAFVYKQALADTGTIEKYSLASEAYLRSSYYALTRKNNDTGTENNDNAFVNYFDLKFSAIPTEELQFNSTLTMYKLWGAWNSPQDVRSADFNYSSKPSDAGIRVKRAYVDYRPHWLGQSVNLTFGRLPTSDGYLTKYRYNRPSQTTYPDLAFNAESDGAALSFYFNQSMAQSLNLVYARSEDDTDMYPFQSDPNGLDDIDFYAVQLNSDLYFMDHSRLVFQWLRVDNIRVTGDDLIRDMIAFYQLPIASIQFPDSLGFVDKYTLQLDNERIFDWPLDFFVSVGWSRSNANGEQVRVNGSVLDPAILPPDLQPYTRYLYLVSTDNQNDESGWAVYTGLRYNVASEQFLQPKIGVEYFTGSQYWVGLNIAALDPYQKLNTRGDVVELYWIQPLVANRLQFRTGYQWIEREYTESLMAGLYGAPEETDQDDNLFYASFEYAF